MLWLNNAGLGPPTASTRAAMTAHLAREDEVGVIVAAQEAEEVFAKGRDDAAALMGCAPEEVAFATTTCANWQSLFLRMPLAGKRVLLAPHEWGENVDFANRIAAMTLAAVERLPALADPSDPSPWQECITDDVAAICVSATTSVGGVTYPIDRVAALRRPHDALVFVDAAQAFGRVDMTVVGSGDVVIGTGRKWLRGPRGVGLLKMSARAKRVLGTTPAEHVAHDQSVPVRKGLCAALAAYRAAGPDAVHAELAAQSAALVGPFEAAGLTVLGGLTRAPGHATVMIPSDRKVAVAGVLERHGVVAKWPIAANDEPLVSVGVPGLPLRLSPHLDTPRDAMEALAADIVAVAA